MVLYIQKQKHISTKYKEESVMKTYEIEFYENLHKYSTTVKAENIENAITFAEIICDIPVGNIVSIKEV